ncbi:hypothetical protein BJ912DRAFT_970925 [Pholiota molesta]|nr:hypothetical protein BJ912DRAFT_970925 [Pholiota molesta]
MAFVYVARKQVTPRELIAAILAFVRAVARVGAHVAGDVLGARERRLADGALVVAAHRCAGTDGGGDVRVARNGLPT